MTRRPYSPATRPTLATRDTDRMAEEAASFLASLPPRPYPWTGVFLGFAILWLSAGILAMLPAVLGY